MEKTQKQSTPNPSSQNSLPKKPTSKSKSIQQPKQGNHNRFLSPPDRFESITSVHKPKKYKVPGQAPSKDKPQDCDLDTFDIFDEEIISTIELGSQQYNDCSLLDLEYLKALPITYKGKNIKIDDRKTMFFKAGYCPVYSDTIYVLSEYNGEGQESTWADLEEPEYTETRNLSFADDINPFKFDEKSLKYLMQAGWIVIFKNKWGFLLNLDSVSEAYDGHLHTRWKVLLDQPFFQDIFNKFGDYIADLHEQNNGISKQVHIYQQLPTTDFDPVIPQGYLPESLHNRLFLHQKQEVGWMFNLENYPALKVVTKDKYIRFLDTGYYIDPQDLSGFVKVKSNNEIIDIIVPGGILASQIGSGKTVTTIALASIGAQFRGQAAALASPEEEFKGNDPRENAKEELNYLLDGVYEPSMIIVTQNILGQWAEEFKKFAPNLRVAMVETVADLIGLKFGKEGENIRLINYDVILTHRTIIEDGEELFEKYCPEIFSVSFRRVMMDEFHELTTYFIEQASYSKTKEREESSKKLDMLKFYKTLNRIDRRFTWGITGTPDSLNYYAEINPLFKLLGLGEQYSEFKRVFKNNDEFIMTCMRKNPRSVDLPELSKSIRKVMFEQLQNILYKGKLNFSINKHAAQEICSHMLKQWRHLEKNGTNYLQVAIENIQWKHQEEILAVKKQMKKNPHDSKRFESRLDILSREDNFFDEVIKLISQKTFDCPICFDECEAEKIVITECLHNLCVTCYEQLKKTVYHLQCPVCREHVQSSGLVIHPKFAENQENKLTAIVQAIEETPMEDKIIIFTQFHSLVEHLSEIFNPLGIQYMLLRGEPTEINISLAKFKLNPELKILLMSVEQAASGINVQEANHVFFAHPIFGMEFEKAAITYNQCIGRAYRIGQTKKVNVKLFVTEDSLETNLVPSFNRYGDPLK